jgi:hypothetical protein
VTLTLLCADLGAGQLFDTGMADKGARGSQL